LIDLEGKKVTLLTALVGWDFNFRRETQCSGVLERAELFHCYVECFFIL